MMNRFIVILCGLMLMAAQQSWAMDTPMTMKREDVRGPYMALCQECDIFVWDPGQPQRYGKGFGCRCKTVYGKTVSSQIWLRACKNGTVQSDPRTGKLTCYPDVTLTPAFNKYCKLSSDIKDTSKLKTNCWTKPAKKGFSIEQEIDLMMQCGGMGGPPLRLIIDAKPPNASC
jgi:hypothetical protein